MLTPNQEKYLLTIPEDKIAKIVPYDPRSEKVAEEIIKSVNSVDPNLEIWYLGASALKIAGQNDLDIYICAYPENFHKHLSGLKEVFGEPINEGRFIEWNFNREGFEVDLNLTDCAEESNQEQKRIFDILSSNKDLLNEYEALKLESNGKPFRDYQRKKYEFYNRVLSGESASHND
jgi:hypothetical protein